MNVLITLSSAGASTGPTFNLYSDVDTYATPFETGVAKSALLAGYTSTVVPNAATMIRVQSVGTCTNYGLFSIAGVTTTTTTTAGGGTTTTTTTAGGGTTTTTTTPTPTTTTTTTSIFCFIYNGQNNNVDPATIFWTNCDGTPGSEVVDPSAYSTNFCAREGSVSAFNFTINTIEPCNSPVTTTTTTTGSTPTTTTTTTYTPVYYTFDITGGYSTSEDACLEGSAVTQIYGYNILFLDNAIFYSDSSLTTPYSGNSLYYKNTATNQWSRISNTGDNIEEGNC